MALAHAPPQAGTTKMWYCSVMSQVQSPDAETMQELVTKLREAALTPLTQWSILL